MAPQRIAAEVALYATFAAIPAVITWIINHFTNVNYHSSASVKHPSPANGYHERKHREGKLSPKQKSQSNANQSLLETRPSTSSMTITYTEATPKALSSSFRGLETNILTRFSTLEDGLQQFPRFDGKSETLFSILNTLNIQNETSLYLPKEKRYYSKGIYCKNIFLKDRKGQFYLIICHEDTRVDLKALKVKSKAHRNLSFATEVELNSILHVDPGAVTPFALLHHSACAVKLVMTSDIADDRTLLNFHPMDKDYATSITFESLCKFLYFCKGNIQIIDM